MRLRNIITTTILGGSAVFGSSFYINQTTRPDIDDVLYKVVDVKDGDTIQVLIDGKKEKVRMIGLDSPESVHPFKPVECYGKESSDFTKSALKGKQVYLKTDQFKRSRDLYNRLLRYVILPPEDENFNLMLVARGYAYAKGYGKTETAEEFKEAEEFARENKLGLWNICIGNYFFLKCDSSTSTYCVGVMTKTTSDPVAGDLSKKIYTSSSPRSIPNCDPEIEKHTFPYSVPLCSEIKDKEGWCQSPCGEHPSWIPYLKYNKNN